MTFWRYNDNSGRMSIGKRWPDERSVIRHRRRGRQGGVSLAVALDEKAVEQTYVIAE